MKASAQKMVAEHNKMSMGMQPFAASWGVTPPSDTDADHQKEYEKLNGLSGADFDKEYIDQMVSDHAKALDYLRENFYGGILAGEYQDQVPGAMDKNWNSAYQAYLGLANTVGIDRVLFTADAPYGSMKAGRQFFDQIPIDATDKEKIAHLNAERLLGLSFEGERILARTA